VGDRPEGAASDRGCRGATLERLILDTTVLVRAERAGAALDEIVSDEDDVAIAAVTAAELLVGVELADDRYRESRRTFVNGLLDVIPAVPYDLEVARCHAPLLAHTRRSGRPRGAHDLLIAATAVADKRTVVSADPSGFVDLPGVTFQPASR
jgi:tRNA(fMet)-specific endonuclease VapC